MPDIDSKLQDALKQAKLKPMLFVFVAKGASDGVLLVSKTKIATKDVDEAKEACGSSTVYRGRCLGEEDSLVFETDKEPPASLAGVLKKIAARDAGLTLTVLTRAAVDPQAEPEKGVTKEGTPPAPQKAPGPPPAPDLVDQVTATLTHLAPEIKAAVAAHPERQKDLLGAVARAQDGAKNNHPGDVKAALIQVNAILKELGAAPPPAPPPGAKGVDEEPDERAEWEEVKKVLVPEVKQAVAAAPAHKDRLLKLLAAVNDRDKADDYEGALELAEGLFAAIDEATAEGGEGALPEVKDVAVDGPAVWRAAREKVDVQIAALQQALKKTGRPGMARIAEYGLNGITGGLGVRLTAALMDLAAGGNDGGRAKAKALAAVDEYDAFLKGDDVVALCEKNPLGVKVTARATLGEALGRLRKALAAG